MDKKYLIKLSKEYEFEGSKYNEIDLSKIEDLKSTDLDKIDKIYQNSGGMPLLAEMSRGYAMLVASEVTGLPKEFFDNVEGIYKPNLNDK